jgi:hypothetical protein
LNTNEREFIAKEQKTSLIGKLQGGLFSFFKESLSRKRYVIKGKI